MMGLFKDDNFIDNKWTTLPNIEALYIHIPFCLKKCHYCDFVSYPVAGQPVKEYCQALIREGKMYYKLLPGSQKEIKSLYIGGGTPTCLPAKYLAEMISELKSLFPVQKQGEITVECNPRTVHQASLEELKRAGVNRLSIGAQSFNQDLLREMGRGHGAEDIFATVAQAREAGFTNINLDLIYGLPGQTMVQWSDTLANAVSLPVTHISAYGLKLSEQSFWGKCYAEGTLKLPDQDLSADMQELAMDYLKDKGFVHYEIANFARPGFFSSHNRVYWNNGNYLGLGLAAASHYANVRQTNEADLISYLLKMNQGRLPIAEREVLDLAMEMGETVFLGLRLMEGLSLNRFKKLFGIDLIEHYEKQVEKLAKLGLLTYDHRRIRLTQKGIFLANEVFMEFLP